MYTEDDVRLDGFTYLWDYPDDPDEPCWDNAAKEAIVYIAGLLGLNPDTDFKIECQSVDLREELVTNFIGSNEILISYNKYLNSPNKDISLENLGFIIDGFLTGWLASHSEIQSSIEVHPERDNLNVNWEGIAQFVGVPVSEVKETFK